MRIEVVKTRTLVPTYRGNQELPPEEQISITATLLTYGQRSRYIYDEPVETSYDGEKMASNRRRVEHRKGLVEAMLQKEAISNLTVAAGDQEQRITTARELYGTPGVPAELVEEIEQLCLEADPEVREVPLG